jgi:hypothetical protein
MAGGMQVSRGGNGPGGITNLTAQTTGSVQTVTLTAPSNVISIINYSSGILGIDFNGGTPTTSASGGNGLQIGASNNFTYDGCALTSFTLIGSAGSLLFGIIAH